MINYHKEVIRNIEVIRENHCLIFNDIMLNNPGIIIESMINLGLLNKKIVDFTIASLEQEGISINIDNQHKFNRVMINEVIPFAAENKKVMAIKALRCVFDIGLKEANKIINTIQVMLGKNS